MSLTIYIGHGECAVNEIYCKNMLDENIIWEISLNVLKYDILYDKTVISYI